MKTGYLEIEHKYLIGEDFDVTALAAQLAKAGAGPEKHVQSRDTYFYHPKVAHAVFRHRLDAELHQLTVKSNTIDAEVRREVNLDLAGEDAVADVAAFLEVAWGRCAQLQIWKDIRIWELPNFEVVHYTARRADGFTVRCVEFEFVGEGSAAAAIAAIEALGRTCGFDPMQRTTKSLLQLISMTEAAHG